MKINDDRSLAGMIPIAIGCGVAISYSGTKWQRGPEDSQSVAFLGLTDAHSASIHGGRRRNLSIGGIKQLCDLPPVRDLFETNAEPSAITVVWRRDETAVAPEGFALGRFREEMQRSPARAPSGSRR